MSVQWKGGEIIAAVRQAAMRAVVRGVEAVHEEATSLILDGPKSGRVYRRRGVEHQASAPGEAFASDTGRLVQSGRTKYDKADLSGTVQWSTQYAEHLEHGTERMEPRPFARPALANLKVGIESGIAEEINAALK